MSYPTDTSVQLNYTTVTILPTFSSVTTPLILFNDGTSGLYNPSNNVIKMFTNNIDALTIDSNQCLYGNGTGLTNIGYNNVIYKPNNFVIKIIHQFSIGSLIISFYIFQRILLPECLYHNLHQ